MEIVKANKIKDIEEFCKLFKVNIPMVEEFEYYLETLKKSPEYTDLLSDENLSRFSAFENWISENTDHSGIRSYKMRCLDILKDYIIQTKAYADLQSCELPKSPMSHLDLTNSVVDNQILVSLDFKSANYSVLKKFDVEGELKSSWADLCKHLNIHEVLASSKSFRQLVFGNTNPKRLQTMQHYNIMQVKEWLKPIVKDEQYVFISHDEIIFKLDREFGQIDSVIETISKNVGMSIRCTFFITKKIKKNTFVKTVYNAYNESFEERYRTLHGVQGNKFYMYFKKYILNEQLDERDLMYYNDGELCQWVNEDDKAKKQTLPHYEKPRYVISMDEAKKEYSYLWDNMTSIVPNLSSEEKRRVIEIVIGACKHCFQEESGCKCWDDN